ncbi:MAG: hypothetical protein DRQ88_08170 [Epsilonproteobacteria bacterium]|nr:MAG: hypothetical protein DRQ89_09190 [Campylobacterota bacterium]RLA66024.1 MAG: hypothetical protein DRQ88_08170 [Campylobacterota bacterium]
MKKLLKSEDGQTAVEYILLIAVMSTIAFSIMKIAKERLLADADNCSPESKSMVCLFKNLYDKRDFVYFTIMRTR